MAIDQATDTDPSDEPTVKMAPKSGSIRPARLHLKGAGIRMRDGRHLLQAIDLDVGQGERLAIIGPNGAGKSTLLKLMSGRLAPTAGAVSLDGRDLHMIPIAERARSFAIVGQNDHPDLRLKLVDYVDLGRIPHRTQFGPVEHAKIVQNALDRVGLGSLGARPLASLSGGERQRAGIARAIAQEPSILILDEPTNHLDPHARADVLDLVRGLGIIVIAVLHDLPLVSPFADRVAIMRTGRLVTVDVPARALRPDVVRDVFAMDCFPFINPSTGRSLLVFDTPGV